MSHVDNDDNDKNSGYILWIVARAGSRIQTEVKVVDRGDIDLLANSETRIVLLYSTKEEANNILLWAREKGLTTTNYVWIVTQSVIGPSQQGQAEALAQFPIGMLGQKTIIIKIPVGEGLILQGCSAAQSNNNCI